MTLIAAYKEEDVPVLVGDVLITPSIGDYYEEHCKKINKINPLFVVGWTGGQYDGVGTVKLLVNEFEKKRAKKAEIESFLVSLDVSKFEGQILINGWIIDDDGQHAFLWNSENNKYGIKTFASKENVKYIKGSGEKFYRDLLNDEPLIKRGFSKTTNFGAAHSILRQLSGLIFGEYLAIDMSWRDRFGFGYEALIFDGEQFNYLNNVLYLVFDFHFDNDLRYKGFSIFRPAIKYKSFGHFCAFEKEVENGVAQYFVGPGYQKIEKDVEFLYSLNNGKYTFPAPEIISLKSRCLVNGIVTDNSLYTTFERDNDLLRIKYTPNGINYWVRQGLINSSIDRFNTIRLLKQQDSGEHDKSPLSGNDVTFKVSELSESEWCGPITPPE